MVVRYAFVYWYGRSTCSQKCSGAATEDGVIVSFAELGIKVNLHTPRICEENVPRDGYGNACLVHVRRDAMSDFASSLTWFSIGVVHGDRKVSMEAMVQLATSMHGEMRCRGFSSSLLGLVTARHILRGAMAQYAKM